jgi:hypothetical protein
MRHLQKREADQATKMCVLTSNRVLDLRHLKMAETISDESQTIIGSTSSAIDSLHTVRSAVEGQNQSLARVENVLSTSLMTNEDTRQTMQMGVETIHSKLQQVTDVSATQISQLVEKLDRLLIQSESSTTPCTHNTETGPGNQEASQVKDTLSEAIYRLLELVSDKLPGRSSLEAEEILDDLESILTLGGNGAKQQNLHESSQGVTQKALANAIRRGLTAADHFAVKNNGTLSAVRGYGFSHQSSNIEIKECMVSISRGRKRKRHDEDSNDGESDWYTDTFGKLTILPKGQRRNFKLQFMFEKRLHRQGAATLYHNFSFCSIREHGNEVFKMVETGDLEGLRSMFANGEASISDCDPDGNSLLTVSTRRDQIHCVIPNGAEARFGHL